MALVEVHFAPVDKTVFVAPGTTLLAASRLAGLDLATGCTRGMCGTDAVRIVSGLEHLAPPAEAERGTLSRMGLGPEFRLSCSATVLQGRLSVELDAF